MKKVMWLLSTLRIVLISAENQFESDTVTALFSYELREDLKCICQNQEITLYAAYPQ